MIRMVFRRKILFTLIMTALAIGNAQAADPTMLDPNLSVRTVVAGLNQPTTMVFLGPTDILVLEKATGRVRRVTQGVIQSTVLDLAVNSASERGLLGVALHPDFPINPRVYLFWTESTTGADSSVLAEVPLLGNRVDRFVWNGSTLTFDHNLIKLRAFQADAGQPPRGNHNGGVMKFGPDRKLYIFMGDNGRRGEFAMWADSTVSRPAFASYFPRSGRQFRISVMGAVVDVSTG